MDLGTGGGFPGIPLAILMPDVEFHLVDSVGKKVKVAETVAKNIGLTNVTCSHCRAEDIKAEYDFIVSRAVMPFVDLMKCGRKNISKKQRNSLPNGFVVLKGGDGHGLRPRIHRATGQRHGHAATCQQYRDGYHYTTYGMFSRIHRFILHHLLPGGRLTALPWATELLSLTGLLKENVFHIRGHSY